MEIWGGVRKTGGFPRECHCDGVGLGSRWCCRVAMGEDVEASNGLKVSVQRGLRVDRAERYKSRDCCPRG